MSNLCCENEFYSHENKKHFHINSLALKQRLVATRNRPISSYVYLLRHFAQAIRVSATLFNTALNKFDHVSSFCNIEGKKFHRVSSFCNTAHKKSSSYVCLLQHCTPVSSRRSWKQVATNLYRYPCTSLRTTKFQWYLPSATLHATVFQTPTNCMFLPRSVLLVVHFSEISVLLS